MANENDARYIVYLLLKYMGIDDAETALECDHKVCNDLIINVLVGNEDFQKFLRYMRS